MSDTDRMHRDHSRELGEHDARLATLEREMGELRADVKEILRTLSEAKGGWRTLMVIGGACAAIGAGLLKIYQVVFR